MDRELLQDSEGVNESFWDGLGVEFEAKYILDFRGAPRGGSGVRAGRGATAAPGRGDTAAPGRGDTRPPPDGGTPPSVHTTFWCVRIGGGTPYMGVPPPVVKILFFVCAAGGAYPTPAFLKLIFGGYPPLPARLRAGGM